MLNSIFGRMAAEESLEKFIVEGFADVSAEHRTYYDIMEATTGHEYSKDENGTEEWTALK